MNIVNQIKAQQQIKKLQKQLLKMKDEAPMDFKWFGLASCCGIVTDLYRVTNPYIPIGEAKLMFPEIKTEEDLDRQLCTFKDAVKEQSNKVMGKFYTKQAFKGVEDGD